LAGFRTFFPFFTTQFSPTLPGSPPKRP